MISQSWAPALSDWPMRSLRRAAANALWLWNGTAPPTAPRSGTSVLSPSPARKRATAGRLPAAAGTSGPRSPGAAGIPGTAPGPRGRRAPAGIRGRHRRLPANRYGRRLSQVDPGRRPGTARSGTQAGRDYNRVVLATRDPGRIPACTARCSPAGWKKSTRWTSAGRPPSTPSTRHACRPPMARSMPKRWSYVRATKPRPCSPTVWPLTAITRCKLHMLRVRPDRAGALKAAIMSDLGLARYHGYAALPAADALKRRLDAEQPEHRSNGVHLIAVQSADGSLVVGDSHHYGPDPDPVHRARGQRPDPR